MVHCSGNDSVLSPPFSDGHKDLLLTMIAYDLHLSTAMHEKDFVHMQKKPEIHWQVKSTIATTMLYIQHLQFHLRAQPLN
jgi:hypothetical protein